MEIFSMIIGLFMLLGMNIKHNNDENKTGLWVFSSIYILCATSLILLPTILNIIN